MALTSWSDTEGRGSPAAVGRALPERVADPSRPSREQPVLIQVQASIPINGKRAFTVTAPMATPFAELKRLIARSERLFPSDPDASAPERLTLRLDDYPAPCANDSSLFALGYDAPPLLHLSGFAHEYFLRIRGSSQRWAVPWWPHISVTDLVRHAYTRLKPYDLRYCRLVCERADGSRQEIPMDGTFTYALGVEIAESTTVAEVRAARGVARAAALGRFADVATSSGHNLPQLGIDEAALRDPAVASAAAPHPLVFVRTQDGNRVEFRVDVRPDAEDTVTIGDIRKAIVDFCWTKGAEQQTRGDGSSALNKEVPRITVSLNVEEELRRQAAAAVAEHEYPEHSIRDPFEALGDPFDDDDEEVAPRGEKRTYCHDHDLLVPDAKATKDELHHVRFLLEAAQVTRRIAELTAMVRDGQPIVLSFNPPRNQYSDVARPAFVDPADNFDIPHLSDLRVRPDSEVFVEYFDPHSQRWSDEVARSLRERGRVVAPGQRTKDSRSVTVKNGRGSSHRFDVLADVTTVEDIASLQFCATGDLPMFFLFAADGGRYMNLTDVVCPVVRAPGSALLPSPTVYAVHRPRPWLGEPLEMPPVERAKGSADALLNPLSTRDL